MLLVAPATAGVTEFTTKVTALSKCIPFSVTSWIRTPSRNKDVGGHPESLHLKGLAVDLVLDNKSDTGFFVRKARSLGLFVSTEKDHIHISLKNKGDLNDTTGDNNPSRIYAPWRGIETMGNETQGRTTETRADNASVRSSTGREDRDPIYNRRQVHMDKTFHSNYSSAVRVRPPEDSPLPRSRSGLWLDGVESRVLVYYRW